MKRKFTHTVMTLIVSLMLIIPVAKSGEIPKRQDKAPIIDMHVHVHWSEEDWPWGSEFAGLKSSANAEAYFEEAYGLFRKYNIKAVVSSSLELVEKWKSQDEDNRIIPALLMLTPSQWDMNPERFESLVKSGRIKIFGELGPIYSGGTLSDSEWQPYLKICEQYDIPVAVHTGSGVPAVKNTFTERARQRLGDPYLIEDVIVEYPKLRIYLCHSGQEFHEHALMLMDFYPQVYSDLAALLDFSANMQRLCREFLVKAQQDGVLDRVMFGSDIFMTPKHLEIALEYLDSLEFLTKKEKRDILYNNAARFLRLK